MREQRALQHLESNTLSTRWLPRSAWRDRSGGRVRQSLTSMSKTPKISNRLQFSKIATKGKPPRTPSQFVTRRNRRTTRAKTRDSPRDPRPGSLAFSRPGREQATADKINIIKCRKSPPSGDVITSVDTSLNKHDCNVKDDDDMELCSDSDSSTDLSPDSDRLASKVVFLSTPLLDRGAPYLRNIQSKKPEEEATWPRSSPKGSEAGSSQGARFVDHESQDYGRTNGPADDMRLERMQKDRYFIGRHLQSKTDNPLVLDKLLYGDKSLLGTEIGSADWQQESLNGSEITGLTLCDDLPYNKPLNLMPSFPPRYTVDQRSPRRATDALDNETESHETVEEWSLPDEEANHRTEFIIDGKKYIHDPLPSGWAVKVSRNHNKPFYIHPDHGITWHCPIILKSKSNARVFKRSNQYNDQEKTKHTMKGIRPEAGTTTPPSRASAMKARRISFDGSMSELVKYCTSKIWKSGAPKPYDGYEGSESSAFQLSDTDTEIETVSFTLNGSTDTESTWSDLVRKRQKDGTREDSTALPKHLFTPGKESVASSLAPELEGVEATNSASMQSGDEVAMQDQGSSNESPKGISSEVRRNSHSPSTSEDQPNMRLCETPKSTISLPFSYDEHCHATPNCVVSKPKISPRSSGSSSENRQDATFSTPIIDVDVVSTFHAARKSNIDHGIIGTSKELDGQTSVSSLRHQLEDDIGFPISNSEREEEASPEEAMAIDSENIDVMGNPDESFHEQTLESNTRNACNRPRLRPFGFRVLFPSHPICSLQRLDGILKKKQELCNPTRGQKEERIKRKGKKGLKTRKV